MYRRPYLEEFLAAVSSFCELWVYTASEKEYADEILNNIDLNGLITKRFYRDVRNKSDIVLCEGEELPKPHRTLRHLP